MACSSCAIDSSLASLARSGLVRPGGGGGCIALLPIACLSLVVDHSLDIFALSALEMGRGGAGGSLPDSAASFWEGVFSGCGFGLKNR